MQFNETDFHIRRYPNTNNRSLKPWNAADELLISTAQEMELQGKQLTIAHDTFGALAINLHNYNPCSIISNHSQLRAIRINLEKNDMEVADLNWVNPLKLSSSSIDIALIKIPKSSELFELYVQQIFEKCTESSVVLCGFMTRNFTAKWIQIAERYFQDVAQSKASKKARLLILKKRKVELTKSPLFHLVKNNLGLNIKQYAGVFSSSKIDPATQVLLEELPDLGTGLQVMDLACGNGVVSAYIKEKFPQCDLHLMDDSFLATSSAKLNLPKDRVTIHWSNTMTVCQNQKFDYILCNPPFHFEYETNIEISIKLFTEAAVRLKPEGKFILVANRHLNYTSHLSTLFQNVIQIKESGKYEVLSCYH